MNSPRTAILDHQIRLCRVVFKIKKNKYNYKSISYTKNLTPKKKICCCIVDLIKLTLTL